PCQLAGEPNPETAEDCTGLCHCQANGTPWSLWAPPHQYAQTVRLGWELWLDKCGDGLIECEYAASTSSEPLVPRDQAGRLVQWRGVSAGRVGLRNGGHIQCHAAASFGSKDPTEPLSAKAQSAPDAYSDIRGQPRRPATPRLERTVAVRRGSCLH